MAAACCGACAGDSGKCISWLLLSEEHDGFSPGTCILNDHLISGEYCSKTEKAATPMHCASAFKKVLLGGRALFLLPHACRLSLDSLVISLLANHLDPSCATAMGQYRQCLPVMFLPRSPPWIPQHPHPFRSGHIPRL